VTGGGLLAAFAVGAGLIALWVDGRFPKLMPGNLVRTLIHVGLSIVVVQLVVPTIGRTLPGGPVGIMLLLFCIAFPALVYCLLTSVWIIKTLQGAIRQH
jgi:hypothetical protein